MSNSTLAISPLLFANYNGINLLFKYYQMKEIQIMLVDDQSIVRDGIKALLINESTFNIIVKLLMEKN